MNSTEIYALVKAGIKGIGRLLLSALQGLAGLVSVAVYGLLTATVKWPKITGAVVLALCLVVAVCAVQAP